MGPGWQHVLVKRREVTDAPGSIVADVAYAAMARTAGIGTMPVTLLRAMSGEPFFVTDQFDRFDRDGRGLLHMQTFAALPDADFRSATPDYLELLRLTRIMTRVSARSKRCSGAWFSTSER